MHSKKVKIVVTPAKAGAHKYLKTLDSRLLGNDGKRNFSTFYETVKVEEYKITNARNAAYFYRTL